MKITIEGTPEEIAEWLRRQVQLVPSVSIPWDALKGADVQPLSPYPDIIYLDRPTVTS